MANPSSSPGAFADRPSSGPGSSAAVLEFICLFTHDLRRKQKRWQDGRLKYHTFNKRIMVYDERGNFIGDMHWRADYDFDEGEEVQLERGGILVQVAECVGQKTQDLSELLDKRVQERQQRYAKTASRPGLITATRPPLAVTRIQPVADNLQPRHRPLHDVVGAPTGHHGRAVVPTESPFAQRHRFDDAPEARKEQRSSKRRRCDDSPPSKMGYAQSLFGTQLSLSAVPMSSAPVRKHPVSKPQATGVVNCSRAGVPRGASAEPTKHTAAIGPENNPGHSEDNYHAHGERIGLVIPNQRVVAALQGTNKPLTSAENPATSHGQQHRKEAPNSRKRREPSNLSGGIGQPQHQLAMGIAPEKMDRSIELASKQPKTTVCPTPASWMDLEEEVMATEAVPCRGSEAPTDDGPRTSLRIKPRRKRGLLIACERPALRKVGGIQVGPTVLQNAKMESSLAFQDQDSDITGRNPFAPSPSPGQEAAQRRYELPSDGGKQAMSCLAPLQPSSADYSGANDGIVDSYFAGQGDACSNRRRGVMSAVEIPADIPDKLVGNPSNYDRGDSRQQETSYTGLSTGTSDSDVADASKLEQSRVPSEGSLRSRQSMAKAQCPSPPRQRRSARKILAASDSDEEPVHDSIGATPYFRPGAKQDNPADEHPRVPVGPRLARLGRKSIKSKEVIGFVASSPPAIPRFTNLDLIDEPLPNSAHLNHGASFNKKGGVCPPLPLSVDDEILMGPRCETPTPSPVRSEARSIPGSLPRGGSDSDSAHSRQTATLISPGLPERQDRVVQTRAGDEHCYDVERQQRAMIDANSAKPASSPPLNLTCPTTNTSRGPMPDLSASAKTTSDRSSGDNAEPLVPSTPRDPPSRSRRTCAAPLQQGYQPGSIPSKAEQPVTPASDNSNAVVAANTCETLITGSKAPARLVNPATRGRKAALRSDAAGRAPESLLSLDAYSTRPPVRGSDSTASREAPKRRMRFPGFSSASGGGPWSREAHDLLETGRPE